MLGPGSESEGRCSLCADSDTGGGSANSGELVGEIVGERLRGFECEMRAEVLHKGEVELSGGEIGYMGGVKAESVDMVIVCTAAQGCQVPGGLSLGSCW